MSLVNSIRSLSFPVSASDISLISEIAYNVLYGSVPLEPEETNFFKTNKPVLRVLVGKYNSKRKLNVLTPVLLQQLVKVALRHLDG